VNAITREPLSNIRINVRSLESYKIDPDRITVSGISAGGFLAHQLHIAYSDIFKGAGLIGCGPYYCARNSLYYAISNGLRAFEALDTKSIIYEIEMLARENEISSPMNLKEHKVWMFRGTNDQVVSQYVVDSLEDLYLQYIPKDNICYVNDIVAPHAMVTDNKGSRSRSKHRRPYINNCDFDSAGEMLNHLYGKLNPRTATPGRLSYFDQVEFCTSARAKSMSSRGLVYIPAAALIGESCGIHVALHGCDQNETFLGSSFASHAGYNEWAETNNLIVLYPQATKTISLNVFNPKASWDWWGYADANYHTRDGQQMCAIVAMVERLSGA
jgi:hypothetical protein